MSHSFNFLLRILNENFKYSHREIPAYFFDYGLKATYKQPLKGVTTLTSSIRDLKQRNNEVRKLIKATVEENGITYTSIATRCGTSLSSFSQWRTGYYDYSVESLVKVEKLIARYTFPEDK